METSPIRDDKIATQFSFSVSGFGIRPKSAAADESDLQPRMCTCESSLTGSGGDFGFDDGMCSLRPD